VADLHVIEGRYLQDLMDQPKALEDTLAALERSSEVMRMAERVGRGEFARVVLTGMGGSFHALHPLYLQLVEQGFTAVMVETSELIHHQARLFDPKSLIVAVSQSGQSAETVRMLEVNGGRAVVVGVTNTPESPLAKQSAAAVITRAGSEATVSCKTYVSTLMALKWLGDALCGGDSEQSQRELSGAASAVREYLGNWRKYVEQVALRLKGVRQLFLVGRGTSLAAVGAGALVIKESDHFHAEGMSSAAFRHGPFEMLSAETFVGVFAGEEKTRELNLRLSADVRAAGGASEVIGEATEMECFRVAESANSVRPILEILPVQMITIALAALAGREAGKFDRAAKITATE
jgi:glucosamine--fructose-6-phosphate aminotransferase (isomerizing)